VAGQVTQAFKWWSTESGVNVAAGKMRDSSISITGSLYDIIQTDSRSYSAGIQLSF